MLRMALTSLICVGLLLACTAKDFDPENPGRSYVIAKEPYDDGNYELAITKLGEFTSVFPYSEYAKEAALLIADAHFQIKHYPEAADAYHRFVTLHPQHSQCAFAQFRIGQCYWNDASKDADRDLEFISKAIRAWELLIKEYPKSSYVDQARKLIEQGRELHVLGEEFVADFYCRQEIWHACAYRHIQLADTAPARYQEQIINSLEKAAEALRRLSEAWTKDQEDKNLYFKNMSSAELRQQSEKMKHKAAQLRKLRRSSETT
ncbi:MAG: outer membrane protein assembly factor BamD [Deltaproteobacteria bacterium]|nr:outer membrane protein assembly factor BamD [Deltaproteobacteria bacterium]